MRVAVFSSKPYDVAFLTAANQARGHDLLFLEPRLAKETAALASGRPAICAFVNDQLDAEVLARLAAKGTRLIALRSAGYNNVDLPAASRLALTVTRVPAYSPHAVAEHTIALILALNRKVHRAWARIREGNFSLDGLLGFDLVGRTAGVVGTGKIGAAVVRILTGFGCRVLAFDPVPSPECLALGTSYVPLPDLLAASDIVSLHCPLTPETRHLLDGAALARMKPGAMLINTGRGALVDTKAVIEALKAGRLGHLGLDVYEEEAALFFEDRSWRILQDDVFARLLTFPNVIVTGHQGFFTAEALAAIADTTLQAVTEFEQGRVPTTAIRA
jgi:D-lactate dehydrogenase